MCRSTLSVGYNGELYDCDFNQMLGMQLRAENSAENFRASRAITTAADAAGKKLFLWDITPEQLIERTIATNFHCLACTAGSGSSCTGALA